MEKIAITLILALAGGLTGYKIGLPAGAFLGAMTAVSIYNIFSGNAQIPLPLKIIAQIILGGVIGAGLTIGTLKSFKELIIPVVIFVTLLFIFSIASAFILAAVTKMDLPTALFSCSPGGLSEMSILADSYKANVPVVAIIHLSRIMSVVIFYPFIAKLFIK